MARSLFIVVAATAGVAVAIGAAVTSAGAGESGEVRARSISTAGRVLELAADGATVAAVVGSTTSTCARVVIWDVRRTTPTVMQTTSDCPSSRLFIDRLGEIAVGGGMVGVIRLGGGHTVESMLSVTRLPSNGRWTDITGVYDYEYAAGEGDYLSVLGDRSILAFNKWSVCYVYDEGDTCPGVSKGGGWWIDNGQLVEVRVPGSKGSLACPRLSGQDPNHMGIPWRLSVVRACRKIGSGAGFVRAVALDRGRFVALPPQGRVTIVGASGGDVTELPIRTSAATQADLDGTNLLLLHKGRTGSVLDLRNASTGAQVSRTVIDASRVQLEDAHSGIAVYLTGTTIHLLRLADGKSTTITIPTNQGPVRARLEEAGLIYSYNPAGAGPRGRIEFVPLARLIGKLR